MKIFLIAFLILPVIFNAGVAFGNSNFKAGGDWGCKSSAISNIKNLAKDTNSFFGVGDYSYKCSSSTIKPLWDKVPSKQLALGNHECEKSGQDSLKVGVGYSSNGGCSKGYGMFLRGSNTVAVFVLNQYTSYKAGSAQYKFVTDTLKKIDNMTNIKTIIFVFHEPIYPVPCSGSHCHGLEKPAFKSTYEPLIKSHNGIVIQAHTHLTAAGTILGVRATVCGGGGEDGTSLNGNGPYSYVSSKMGFCYFHITTDKVIVQHIDPSGKILHTHTWNN
jgi:hypothetical protein